MLMGVSLQAASRKICFCDLGFPRGLQTDKGRDEFASQVLQMEELVKDPWLLKTDANATVQVRVPKVEVVAPPPPPLHPVVVQKAAASSKQWAGAVDEAALEASAKTKRVALQKKAAAASLVAEDFARRFESGEFVGPGKDVHHTQEEQGLSGANVMCRLCFGGEAESSENARKMLPCKNCGKKYHRSCLKTWSQNRDLFHWSSWSCPSCRICENVICQSRGYLLVHANGGLNQMRAGICDMVAVARIINATLVIPELDKCSFWNDSRMALLFCCLDYNNFSDVFDEDYFIDALKNDVKIIKKLPKELPNATRAVKHFRSWSGLDYYKQEIASMWEEYQLW